ncbi:rod shape-determining protein MreB [Nonlabens tegetincola]|uniref:Cell shape-determining protein MreB n=1 Tax=Nonlabens tegetincola TaxID=323273 RepID=A0A090Q6F8_9FLAO|nr:MULTISPECIES: rod shape-determining protein [Nonlabens]MEE2801113.1 rod shape-determining protein [Bacteroidota bacterium]ALM21379.1 rod shape-determining protein MreB [Nonlabens sp. MIC269]ARN71906.1 rod shape-determining protein [Nonlabens tegetincola]PQJ20485.1 rod shape-determining protein [Nonlabens tegetincola]GAK97787.1 rod shape-determining protein MreB [Nonlabens tegetincola]
MGFFDFLSEDIAIDLGTANTLIVHNGKVVVDSPSIVARNRTTGKIIAVGKEAAMMQGKTHENIKTIRPLKDGVIADFDASEKMISMFIKEIPALKKRLFTPSLRMVICIPSGITEVEMRAVKDSAERVNGKEVYLIHEPMAAAIGIGVDIMQPKGNMIVDIGGGTTEIAVIALGGIVCDRSVKIAGDVFTNDIVYYMRTQHNLYVGERTAEKIKIQIGAATEDLEVPPEEMSVQGRDLIKGRPKEVKISYREIAKALDKSILRVEDAVMETLSQTPPELAADIYNTGIYLAGGGSMLRGLDKRLSQKTDLPVYIAEDPLRAVVRGTGLTLKNLDKYKTVLAG